MQKTLTSHLTEQEINDTADLVEIPLRLIMHGIPRDLVENATRDQIEVLWKVFERDQKEQMLVERAAVNQGVNASFGGDDHN